MIFIQPRIYTHYKSIVCQDLIYTCALTNIMELAKIMECVFNSSSPKAFSKNHGLAPQGAMQCVTGQKSKITRARKSIASFQLKEKNPLGCVTKLRAKNAYSFLDQLITLACPNFEKSTLRYKNAVKLRSSILTENTRYYVNAPHAYLVGVDIRRIKHRKNKIYCFTFGRENFLNFPGLEKHFLAFSDCGGFNCTVCVCAKDAFQLILVLTALQMPLILE